MNSPPPHVQAFRVALVTLVIVLVFLGALLVSWHEVMTVLDPAVDGLRRRIWT